jgi:sulfite dehydrogenase (cytochrome) subunit B
MRYCFALLLLVLTLPGLAAARDRTIQLPPDNAMAKLKGGPGVEVVRANCSPCHSTDYIVRQPRSNAAQWGAEVKKMISDADAKTISEYLAREYGPGKAVGGKQ